MRTIWKNLASRVWLIVTSILVVIMLVVGIVTTQVGLVFGTLNLVFSGYRYTAAEGEQPVYYESKYDSKQESVEASLRLSEEIVSEGIVLLKNDKTNDNIPALPLTNIQNISVFGKHSANMVYGGSGSGGRSSSSVVTLYDALNKENFKINPTLKSFYENNNASGSGRPETPKMGTILAGHAIGETPIGKYTADVKSSYTSYKDAAVVVISRIGGEGYDLPRTMKQSFDSNAAAVEGARSKDDHYLQLDKNETDMLAHVCENFSRVIVLVNSGSAIEMGFLDSPSYWETLGYPDCSVKIQGALWVGNPGGNGNNAVAKVLKGSVNPSGRLVDTYARNFKNDPTWNNFGNNLVKDGNKYFMNVWGSSAVSDSAYFVRYEEGIYIGYRYYETRGETDGEEWYKNNVVYPFGYGLSYTQFSWDVKAPQDLTITGNSEISVTVDVTNNGTVAGKDVVQLYYTAPYDEGKVEKAHVVLGDFAKTELIEPGATKSVTLKLKAEDMASYDYSDANKNGNKGYELDAGDYVIRLARDAHTSIKDITYSLSENVLYQKDTTTEYEVKNRFDTVSNHITKYLSRNNWSGTWPKSPINSSSLNNSYNVFKVGNETNTFFAPFSSHTVSSDYDSGKPWEKTEMPKYGASGNLKLSDLIGEDGVVDYNDKRWEALLDQLTIAEMDELIGIGAFGTAYLPSIGKAPTKEYDGPAGFVIGSFMSLTGNKTEVCFYPCEALIGATWNVNLLRQMGEAIGDEGIWGGMLDGMRFTFSGWYAPAVNIHRSQFGGRNFEYYSEDALLSGKLAAEVCLGAQSNGTYTFVKHFAVNDQETNRSDNGLATWLNEQAMREIYLKPFEKTVKDGKTRAMMSSFNRLGSEWAGASYDLLTEVLRNEWGFKGMVITDFNNGAGSYMDLDKMIRAGGDLNLFQTSWLSTAKNKLTATHVTAMRSASKNILYTIANSNAMNIAVGSRLLPIWVIVMIVVMAGITAVLACWGILVVKRAFKLSKSQKK